MPWQADCPPSRITELACWPAEAKRLHSTAWQIIQSTPPAPSTPAKPHAEPAQEPAAAAAAADGVAEPARQTKEPSSPAEPPAEPLDKLQDVTQETGPAQAQAEGPAGLPAGALCQTCLLGMLQVCSLQCGCCVRSTTERHLGQLVVCKQQCSICSCLGAPADC